MKHHPRIWERPMLLLLFLFGLGAWNRAWVFFLLLAALSLALWGLRTDFSRSEVLLLFFSLFYALADTYHGGLSLRGCALYLLGPWVFYRLGKAYALHTGSCSGFCQLLAAPSLGMWLHGLLNWLARLRWQGEALPARTAVDFWRGEPVSVTCTGMLLTAAAALPWAGCVLRERPPANGPPSSVWGAAWQKARILPTVPCPFCAPCSWPHRPGNGFCAPPENPSSAGVPESSLPSSSWPWPSGGTFGACAAGFSPYP